MEIVLDRCQREKPDFILLPLEHSPTLRSQPDVDSYLSNLFTFSSQFKLGKTERIVYQRINGMKKVNAVLSILYNFSSQGAFPESDIGFYTPKNEDLINITPIKAYDLAKNYVFLDR